MKTLLALVAVACALCACGTAPPVEKEGAAKLLIQADAKLAAEDYTGAISSYNEFATAVPEHPQTGRARATQKALERLVAAQAAMTRTQQSTDASRRELTEKQAEADRLRSEVAKLRADLERLRNIDLQPSRAK